MQCSFVLIIYGELTDSGIKRSHHGKDPLLGGPLVQILEAW